MRAWVESLSPEQIRLANAARLRMRIILRDSPYKLLRFRGLYAIHDDRQLPKPHSPWVLFCLDRMGDLEGSLTEKTKTLAAEYRALSDDEMKVCLFPSMLPFHLLYRNIPQHMAI